MIKAIFFDFEGIITNNPMILHKDLYGKIKDRINFEEFDKKYHLAKVGKIQYKEFMKGLEDYENYILELTSFRLGAKKVLEHFFTKKIPLFLASNHVDGVAEMEVKKLDIKKYFKKMFFSHKLGLAKPDPEFFKKILIESEISLKKGEMIFIDDAKRNLEVAKELGFVTIYVPNGIPSDRRNQIDFKADYEIQNLEELINLFEKISKNSEWQKSKN